MSYEVLARKWRPRTFREMVGQEHVLQALINALDNDRLHHAYLFTGTRGVGKTTVARILAKCLNCERGVSSEPCGECGSCEEIAQGRSIDLIEVDAASRTKVEDTRELLENVQYAPTRSRYKVYLIDEVHMLSAHSFNALLKTLEEPPPHVKFLLATTDPQKLPVTVLSRCLQFNLKNMAPETIVSHLGKVLTEEKVEAEEPALWLLAQAADGSMRDALSLTDQAIAFGSGRLGEQDVRAMLGSVQLSFIYELLRAVVSHDASEVLAVVERMAEHAVDFEGCLSELASLLHRVALTQAVPGLADHRWGDGEQLRGLAAGMTAEDVQLYYQLALSGKRDIGLAPDLRSGMEMTLLRMLAFRPTVAASALPPDVELQVSQDSSSAAEAAAPAKKPEAPPTGAGADRQREIRDKPQTEVAGAGATVVEKPRPAVESQTGPALAPGRWHELLESLGLSGILYNVASHCELRGVEGDKAQLVLDEANASLYNDNHVERLEKALQLALGFTVRVQLEVGVPQSETPAARQQRLADERLAEAVDAIEQDPKVQLLIDQFEGVLDRDSISPIKH
jgi:DNA polymerase-3 subunit gamma/tau